MNEFIKECFKIAASSEMDGLVEYLSKDKKETDKHLNKYIDQLSYQNMDSDSKQQLQSVHNRSIKKI